jgi:uncharacterized protein (TIGR03435 family)
MAQQHSGSQLRTPLLFVTIVATLILSVAFQTRAQSQSPPVAFEVVSIKATKPGQLREMSIQYLPGGRFSAKAVPIPLLIPEAFDTPRLYPSEEFRKLDVSVIERDVYDIEAVAPKDAIAPGSSGRVRNDKIREMLQTLLMDRFKLRVHHEMKEQAVYAIVIGKNGPKLSGAAECSDKPSNFFDPGSCHSMGDLVRFASRMAGLEQPIADKTGLDGMYNMPAINWASIIVGLRGPDDPAKASFDDILDKLGLKVEPQKAVVNMLLVDHVEPPSLEN